MNSVGGVWVNAHRRGRGVLKATERPICCLLLKLINGLCLDYHEIVSVLMSLRENLNHHQINGMV